MSLYSRLKTYAHRGIREARRLFILLVGITVILFGVILIFTPGPAFIVIPAGLAILSMEFAWARRWLKHLRKMTGMEKGSPAAEHPTDANPAGEETVK